MITTNLKWICGVSLESGGAEEMCPHCRTLATLVLKGLPATLTFYDQLGRYDEQVARTLFQLLNMQQEMDATIAALLDGEEVLVTEVERLRIYVSMITALKSAQDLLEMVANGFPEQYVEDVRLPALEVEDHLEPGLRLEHCRRILDQLVNYERVCREYEAVRQAVGGPMRVLLFGGYPGVPETDRTSAGKAS